MKVIPCSPQVTELQTEVDHLRLELQESRSQYKDAAQELAHHEEKLVILEQSLASTQEQLSQRVADVVRLEQGTRKLQTELKTLKERCDSYEDEIHDQKETIGEFRRDKLRNLNHGAQVIQV